ncbi:hypothetical protein [Mesorhizobium sp.]|uniref:hypothetical protein n=1 Tax=Mesorhizobium sp. TaxID=1871066 RepID=UPI00258079BA|nr:hypothetical protein [Mesorhizobium sp.]
MNGFVKLILFFSGPIGWLALIADEMSPANRANRRREELRVRMRRVLRATRKDRRQ